MKRPIFTTAMIATFILFILIPMASAHAPLGTGDNESIDKATVIPDPTKSWALYSQLSSDGDAQYYAFNLTAGQKIHVTLYKSMRTEDAGFTPRLVIVGPAVAAQGDIPSSITVPSGSSAQLVNQTEPTPTYEPFSPSTFTGLADKTIQNPTPGRWYLVVYEQTDTPKGGNYGLAIGERETYTISEWILLPFNLISIYQWEGQNLALILAPMIITVILGIAFLVWRLNKQGNLSNVTTLLGAVGGITFIGTAATTLCQMILAASRVPVGGEALVTVVFIVAPLAIGLVSLRLSLRNSNKISVRKRIYYIFLGFAALFVWAGLIIGPALSIIASVMPTNPRKNI